MPLKPTTKANENSSSEVGFTVYDEDGNVVAGSALSTATYTLKNKNDDSTINSRTDVDFLSSIDESGVASVALVAADNPIVSKSRKLDPEIHIMTVTITSVSLTLVEEVWIRVSNLRQTSS